MIKLLCEKCQYEEHKIETQILENSIRFKCLKCGEVTMKESCKVLPEGEK